MSRDIRVAFAATRRWTSQVINDSIRAPCVIVDIGDLPEIVRDMLSWYEEGRQPEKILVVVIHAVGLECPDIPQVLQWLTDAQWDIHRVIVFDASGAWLESACEAFHREDIGTYVKKEGEDAVQEAMKGVMKMMEGIRPAKH
jgi:hypothetical protein